MLTPEPLFALEGNADRGNAIGEPRCWAGKSKRRTLRRS